jgi:hypothetical protein
MRVFASVTDWWHKHPDTVKLGLFFLGLYGAHFRRFLHWPFVQLGKQISERANSSHELQLQYLRFFQRDAYRLILFLAWYTLKTLYTAFWFSIIGAISFFILFRSSFGFWGIFVGVMVGKGYDLLRVLRHAMGQESPSSTPVQP